MEETAALLELSRQGLYLKRQRSGVEPPESATVSVGPVATAMVGGIHGAYWMKSASAAGIGLAIVAVLLK